MGASDRRQRGATLTLIALASGITLVALAALFLSTSESACRLAGMRAREARAFAAADAGLVRALDALGRDRGAALDLKLDVGDARVEVSSKPGATTGIAISASAGVGPDQVVRRLVATVDVTGSPPRLLSVRRE